LPQSLKNPKLQILNISSNKFTTFPIQLLKLPALKELDVRRNPMESLPQDAKRLGRKMIFLH
jgi:Leucine-rich repeat (LRR) protein